MILTGNLGNASLVCLKEVLEEESSAGREEKEHN